MSREARQAALMSYRLDARRRLEEGGPSLLQHTIPIRGYQLPPCFPLTDKDALRLAHEDLDIMAHDELLEETWRLRFILCFGDFSQAPSWAREWLEERLARCRALLKGGDR